MVELKKWKCVMCGQDVIEGQRFIYVPGKGYAHIECYYEGLKARLTPDIIALMDANEVLAYGIVRLKQAARLAESDSIRDEIVQARKRLEALAARLEKILVDLSGEG